MPATQLVVTNPALAGNNFATQPLLFIQPVITAVDSGFAGDPGYVGTVVPSLNVLTGTPVLGGTEATGKACVSGVCTFTNLTVTGPGTWTITFASGALTPVTTPSWTTYAASKLVVTGAPPTNIPAGAGAFYPIVPMVVTAQTPGSLRDWGVGIPLSAIASLNAGVDNVVTTIVLAAGQGANLPNTSINGEFYGVVWNATDFTTAATDPNAECVKVTTRVTDTLTVVRAQEGSAAVAHNTGGKTYKFARTSQSTNYPSSVDPRITIALNTVSGGPAVVSGPTSFGFIAGECVIRGVRVSAPGVYTYTLSYGTNQAVTVTSGSFTVVAAVDSFFNPDNRLRGLGAALPRTVPSSTPPVQPGASFTVGAGGNYASITAAEAAWFANTINYGDTVVLLDGNTFSESVTWRPKAWTAGFLVIRSQTVSTPAGQRTKPGDWTTQAICQPVNSNNAETFYFPPGSKNIVLQNVQIRSHPSVALNSNLVSLGFRDGDALGPGIPDGVSMDRCYVHHDDPTSAHVCNRAVRWRSKNSYIVNSYFVGFQNTAQPDAQSILCDNTPGNLLLDNNYIEGESEGFMIGGNTFLAENLVPQDVTITRNYWTKPLAQITVWRPKNHLELKAGHRVLIEGNIFDGFWDAAVSQWSMINFKSVNQDGVRSQSWIGMSDGSVRHNFFRNGPDLMQVNGAPQGECEQLSNVIFHNLLACNVNSLAWRNPNNPQGDGKIFHWSGHFDVAIDHVSYASALKAGLLSPLMIGDYGGMCYRSSVTNVLLASDIGVNTIITGTNASPYISAVTSTCDPAATFANNYWAGISDSANVGFNSLNAPATNAFVAVDGSGAIPDPGFTTWAIRATAQSVDPLTICDAFVLTSGAAKGGGTGGSDIGVKDMATLKSKITGVMTGVYGGGGTPPPGPATWLRHRRNVRPH